MCTLGAARGPGEGGTGQASDFDATYALADAYSGMGARRIIKSLLRP